jgi:hypothetical protein
VLSESSTGRSAKHRDPHPRPDQPRSPHRRDGRLRSGRHRALSDAGARLGAAARAPRLCRRRKRRRQVPGASPCCITRSARRFDRRWSSSSSSSASRRSTPIRSRRHSNPRWSARWRSARTTPEWLPQNDVVLSSRSVLEAARRGSTERRAGHELRGGDSFRDEFWPGRRYERAGSRRVVRMDGRRRPLGLFRGSSTGRLKLCRTAVQQPFVPCERHDRSRPQLVKQSHLGGDGNDTSFEQAFAIWPTPICRQSSLAARLRAGLSASGP